MNSDEIMKLLSATAKDDLVTVAQWVNPLPEDAKTLLGKVEMALKMVSYSHNRQGSPAPSQTSIEQLAALKRLKAEIIPLTKS
ncbi:hypothetical protein [Thalassotalea agariperforans]|mgnify:CR=1 FL=1